MRQIFNALALVTSLSSVALAQTTAPAPTNPLRPVAPTAVTAPATPKATAPAATMPAPAATTEKKKSSSEGQLAARERQKKCGVEWKALKESGKQGDQKWPQFWSACNKRLKGA
jgi:hypothetical protein